MATLRPIPFAGFLHSLTLLLVLLPAASAQELSRTPPSGYKKLEPLLTRAEDALAAARSAGERADEGDDSVVVLSETLLRMEGDGRLVRVYHEILRASTDAGAESIARATYPYRRGEQTAHLVLARTLRADGSRIPVRPGAAFVQTPQDQADDALYTDRAEVAIIFPQVEAGSAVEYVVVTEQPQTRIAGELTAAFQFDYFWPTDRVRRVVELPPGLAARLRITPVGDVPAARTESLPGGWVRFSWQKDGAPALAAEPRRAPLSQRGPMLWLSTLPSWESFADWYRGLLAGRADLTPELAAQVDAWTDGLSSRQAIIARLHEKVADDVRYTGLEFGLAGFQPKSGPQVWADRYGDCKDKANLLRAFLRHKGIDSYLTLLDTSHAGAVETRSPDYRHFNHAILAIDRGDGRYTWSDPTIPYLPAGYLGPQDTDRDVLVIRDRGYQFVRTPAQSSGRLEVSFDLELGADGEREGWMTLIADGFRAAAYRNHFASSDRLGTLRTLDGYVQRFFEGAELVDYSVEPADDLLGPRFELRAYFAVPGAYADRPEDALRIAEGGVVIPGLRHDQARETPYFQRREATRVRMRYALPAGWNALELPPPFSFEHEAAAATASWISQPGEVTAEARFETRAALVDPARYESLYQGTRSLGAWLARAVRVAPAANAAPPPAARYQDLARRLAEHLAAQPPGWWTQIAVETPLPDRASFEDVVARYGRQSSVPAYLRHLLELLVSYPPDPDTFSEQLRKSAALAEHAYPDSPLHVKLIDLLLALPPTDDAYYEGLFLQGARLERARQLEPAADLYRRLADDDAVPGIFRAAALEELGRVREAQGDDDAAIATYRRLEPWLDVSYASYDGLLRATLLLLDRGEHEQALRLAAHFDRLDDDSLPECESPDQLQGLGELAADAERARAFWQAQEAWWPAWTELESSLGLPPAPKVAIVGPIDDWGTRMGTAFQAKNAPQYFELWRLGVLAARWQPAFVIEAAATGSLGLRLMPAQASAIRRFILRLLRASPLEDLERQRQKQLLLAAHLIDEGDDAEALEAVRVYFATDPPLDNVRQRMTAMWGLAAARTGEEVPEARAALEELLAQAGYMDQTRPMAVAALSQLYRREDSRERELALLERELEVPAVAGSPQQPLLEQRLTELRTAPGRGELDVALKGWFESYRPPWFDFAEPQNLDDPRIGEVDDAIAPANTTFSDPEKAKIALLAALDPVRPAGEREKAFDRALYLLNQLSDRYSEGWQPIEAVVDDERFSLSMRQQAHFTLVIDAFFAGRPERLDRLFEHPVHESFASLQKKAAEAMRAAVAVPVDSPRALADHLLEVAARPLTATDLTVLPRHFDRLLRHGALEAAQPVLDALADARVQQVDPQRLTQVRLDLARRLRTAREIAPLLDAVEGVVFGRFDRRDAAKPDFWDDLRHTEAIELMDYPDARAARLWELAAGELAFEDALTWPHDLSEAMVPGDTAYDLPLEAALAMIAAAPDDRYLSVTFMTGSDVLEVDDRARLDRLFRSLEPWDPTQIPVTDSFRRVLEAATAMRAGETIDVESLLADLRGPAMEMFGEMLRVAYYLRRGDRDALRGVLASIPSERLVLPFGFDEKIRALEMVGMEEEAAVVREAAAKALYTEILDSWVSPKRGSILEVFSLSESLHQAPAYPDAWLEHVLAAVAKPDLELEVRLRDAELRADWPSVARHASALIERTTFANDLHWSLGRAAYHLGDWPRARDALAVFVRHCRDRLEHSEAVELLADAERRLAGRDGPP